MRRHVNIFLLIVFLLPATGVTAQLVLCDDCLQLFGFSCCSDLAKEDECVERCGPCDDDISITALAVLSK